MTTARDRGDSHPAELVAASLLLLLVLTSLLLWLAGGFAGLAFEGHWPRVAASDLPGVGLRLHDYLDDPRAAWPAQARADLPGPIGMYVGLLAAGALVGAGFAVTLQVRRRTKHGRRRATPHTASWAKQRDLEPLRVTRATPGRLTLGRHARRLIAAEPGQSTLVVAPTQT